MNNVVLLTGASSGIGRETAVLLLKNGYTVYGCARRISMMEDLIVKGLRPVMLDLTDNNSIESCVKQITAEHVEIGVLINNAGYGSYGSVEDVSIDEARRQFEVNLFGLARLTQLLLPYMRKAGSGRIINVSSVGGKIYSYLGAWYHATKHALEGFSDALRIELKEFNIDVVLIEPGLIKTSWDEIAVKHLIETSKGGAYESLASGVAEAFKENYKSNKASNPDVIADTIYKAIKAKKPKTRYHSGKMAGTALFARRIFSDRVFDIFLQMQYGKFISKPNKGRTI